MTDLYTGEPSAFTFNVERQILFRIIPTGDGKHDIVLGDDVTWTEAAEGFWKIVREMMPR